MSYKNKYFIKINKLKSDIAFKSHFYKRILKNCWNMPGQKCDTPRKDKK